MTKTTLLTHIFNEEYILPFWLNHHKIMFDEIIIVDYNSTDKSIELCKSICPDCKIIKTRNDMFDAADTDKEMMDIENGIEGIKIILNATEFLFCETNVKDCFGDTTHPISYSIYAVSPYSNNNYEVNNNIDLFGNLINDDVVFHNDRGKRQIHNFPNGNYTIGRHDTNNAKSDTNKFHIIWFGYYPMNEQLIKRKLQIQQNIPQKDKDSGNGFQHLFDKDKILSINKEKVDSGVSLQIINKNLFDIINKYINDYSQNIKEGFTNNNSIYNTVYNISILIISIIILFLLINKTKNKIIYSLIVLFILTLIIKYNTKNRFLY
jgi:hypothetical protein